MKRNKRSPELRRQMVIWLVGSLIINGLYYSLLALKISRIGGDMSYINTMGLIGLPVIIFTIWVCIFGKSLRVFPYLTAFVTQIQFLFAAYYFQRYTYYFIIF